MTQMYQQSGQSTQSGSQPTYASGATRRGGVRQPQQSTVQQPQQSTVQQPQQGTMHQSQQSTMQQPGTTQQSAADRKRMLSQQGQQFEGDFPREIQAALADLDRTVAVTEWCIDKMIDMGASMAECTKVCQDLATLAEVTKTLVSRNSVYAIEAVELFTAVAEDGLPVIQSQQNPHCQQAAQTVGQTLSSVNAVKQSVGQSRLVARTQQQQGIQR